MKIIHISKSDGAGGAPKATFRLHCALLKNKIESQIWVDDKYSDDVNIFSFNYGQKRKLNKLKFYISRLPFFFFKTANPILHSPQIFSSKDLINKINSSNADIIHLHWVQHEMLSISDISKITKPVVWTLHDMWGFCGAEHISYDNRWINGYNKNNRPKTDKGFDLNRWVWLRKFKYWKKPIQLIAPSNWMGENIRKSYLMNSWPTSIIANTLDTNTWQPIDKKVARKNLGLPMESKLIIFGSASGTKEYHKGFDLLLESLNILEKTGRYKNLSLVIFGDREDKKVIKTKIPVYNLGFIKDEHKLKTAYSASDVFLAPSRIESFGQVVIEANACGLPAVGFNTTGIKTTIKHKYSGYLAKPFDVKDFYQGICWVLDNFSHELSVNARNYVIENFSYSIIANKHIDIYKKLLNK